MPTRDKLTIAITLLLLIVGPYLTYKMVEDARNQSVKLAQTMSDTSATPLERELAEIKSRNLPPIVLDQVALLIVAQLGGVVLSALLIRKRKRHLKSGRRA